MVGCRHGYLSGVRCGLAYGPADATAIHCLSRQTGEWTDRQTNKPTDSQTTLHYMAKNIIRQMCYLPPVEQQVAQFDRTSDEDKRKPGHLSINSSQSDVSHAAVFSGTQHRRQYHTRCTAVTTCDIVFTCC